jgi:hypothetical protein
MGHSKNKGQIQKFLESNENENGLSEPLGYSKGSAINAYIKKKPNRCQINNGSY